MLKLITSPLLLVAAILSGIYILVKASKIGKRGPGLPPGPPTVPVLGNLHLIPSKKAHVQFAKWAQEYGPVYSLILGTKTMIVLSSDTSVKDLLDRRSANYSSRPDMYVAQDIASGGLRIVLMKYGETWRKIRSIIHNILNVKAAVTYVPYQDLENKVMLAGLLDTPNDFLDHVRRFTFSLSTQMIFGFRAPDIHDPRLQQLFWGFGKWGELAGSASAQISDLFPAIQKLPKFLAPNVKYAERLHRIEKKLFLGLWMDAKRGLESGKGLPCFCNDLLRAQKQDPSSLSDDLAAYTSGSLLEAGSETTAVTLYAFIQALVVWPEVQAKVREEVDRVVGPGRLPTMYDYNDLPYVHACIKESLRWMPVVILGMPHAVIKEDSYMGYKIPAGATVITNVWAIHMDANRSPSPRVFNPDRFLSDTRTLYESAIGDAKLRDNYVFGAGRRICQGIHIAERSLFLSISRLIWGFEFSPALDAKGEPINYDVDDLVGALTVEPRHYDCVIKPRSEERSAVMRKAAEDCEVFLNPETRQWSQAPEGMAFSTLMPENGKG